METTYEDRLAIYKSTIFQLFKAMLHWALYTFLEDRSYYKMISAKSAKSEVKWSIKHSKYGALRNAAADRVSGLQDRQFELKLYRRN